MLPSGGLHTCTPIVVRIIFSRTSCHIWDKYDRRNSGLPLLFLCHHCSSQNTNETMTARHGNATKSRGVKTEPSRSACSSEWITSRLSVDLPSPWRHVTVGLQHGPEVTLKLQQEKLKHQPKRFQNELYFQQNSSKTLGRKTEQHRQAQAPAAVFPDWSDTPSITAGSVYGAGRRWWITSLLLHYWLLRVWGNLGEEHELQWVMLSTEQRSEQSSKAIS